MHPNWKCLSTVPFNFKNFVRESKYECSNNKTTPKPIIPPFSVAGGSAKSVYDSLISEKYLPCRIKKVNVKLKTKTADTINNGKKNFNINSFMRWASNDDDLSLKDMLNEYPEKINSIDDFGWTALMCAAHANAANVVEMLLKKGADHTIADKSGNTAILLARKVGNKSIVDKITEQICSRNRNLDSGCNQEPEVLFCDSCNQSFRDCSLKEHETSILHLLNKKQQTFGTIYGISMNNKGYQLMLKKGWDKETGLGPSGNGSKFPIKTVIRDGRTGLGIAQPPARISHSIPNTKLVNRNNIVKKRNHIKNHLIDKRKEHRFRLMLS